MRHIRAAAEVIHDINGKPMRMIGVNWDVSAEHEADKMKNEFISIVSHELRTPLTSIRGSLGLIEGTMFKDIPEKARNLINIAHKNSERLILLINDILDLDKIAAGKMKFQLSSEKVTSLVHDGIEINSVYAEKHKVKFFAEEIDDNLSIKVDADRWQQAFTNLLSNAAKFSPEGSEVKIAVHAIGGKIRVSIKDNGPGIPEEFRSRIFTKFSQADSVMTRQKGGSGLGLNISREIVTRMGGNIGFDSTAGKGSTFWFEFPDISTEDDRKSDVLIYNEQADMDTQVPRILHIEDDVDLFKVLKESLHGKAELVIATTLAAAKKISTMKKFDLAIIDIGLPDGSGLSFIDFMHVSGKPMPVIVLSAHDLPDEFRKKVDVSLVKARTSEKQVVDVILSHLPQRGS